jgi:hypothetical protein
MTDFSKSALVQFLDMLVTKGWVNTNTGAGWKAAVNTILQDVEPDQDVREIDVKSAVLRYHNRNPGDLAPDSLKRYEQRVAAGIGQFVSFKTDPTNYKAPSRGLPNGSKAEPKKRVEPKATPAAFTAPQVLSTKPEPDHPAVQKPVAGTATDSSLALPFPLRPGFLAQVVIPRDLSKDEAARLCAFIQALAHDPAPTVNAA